APRNDTPFFRHCEATKWPWQSQEIASPFAYARARNDRERTTERLLRFARNDECGRHCERPEGAWQSLVTA
ncbi:MAG: hypothetical protein ACP5TY_10240, partial [Thermodesulforhabdaceae bacterium]